MSSYFSTRQSHDGLAVMVVRFGCNRLWIMLQPSWDLHVTIVALRPNLFLSSKTAHIGWQYVPFYLPICAILPSNMCRFVMSKTPFPQ